MSTSDEIEKLADKVVADALKADVKLADRIEALKTLKDIYVVLMKHKDKHVEEPDEINFNGLRHQIDAADEGLNRAPAEIRSGRRRRAVS